MAPPTVVVVGSINVDFVVTVEHLPRPGETVTGGTFARHDGGKGANQAVAAARLGATTYLIGCVGSDELGRSCLSALDRSGVHSGLIRTVAGATGVASIIVDSAGENVIAVAPAANATLTAEQVRQALAGLTDPAGRAERAVRTGVPAARPAVVVLASLEVPLAAVLAAAEVAAERGWPFVLNPAPARALPRALVALTTLITPNQHEVAGLGYPGAVALLAAGAGAVAVTRAADGVELHQAAGRHRQSAFVVDPIDSTGAGDAFNGAVAWAMARGLPLPDCVRWGAAAGALACTARGARAGLPTATQLRAFVDAPPRHR